MSTGADPKTMPVTREYEDGFDRIFGKREPVRGVWVYLPDGTPVPADEYVPPAPKAKNAPIMVDRFYENTAIRTDTNTLRDVGSRRKYREYLKETGYTHASDYTETWKKKAAEREATRTAHKVPSKTRRETLERAMYKLNKP